MTRFSCALIGDETLLAGCGDQLLEGGHSVRAVVTGNAQVRDWAEGHGLSVLADMAGLAQVGGFDWLFSIANLAVIPDEVLALPAKGAVNFHDGPLPGYAGLNTPIWALLAGEERHGVTWHMIESGIDRGDILATREVAIDADETAHSLNSKCYAAGLESFAALLKELEADDIQRQPQDFAGRQYFSAAHRPVAAARIDFTRPAAEIARIVRALDFGGYWNPLGLPRVEVAGNTLFARKAEVADSPDTQPAPGQVLSVTGESLRVATAEGAVLLSDLVDAAGLRPALAAMASPDDILTSADETEANALTKGAAALAPHQGTWRKRLSEVEPVQVPMASASGSKPDWETIDLDIPAELPADQAMAVLAIWAVQGAGVSAADVAYTPAALSQNAVAAPWVPLRVETGTTLDDTAASLAAQMADGATQVGFADDLGLRDPALAGLRTPAIAIGDGQTDLPGVCIRAVPGHGTVCLSFDKSRLSPAAITLLKARLVQMFERLSSTQAMADLLALPEAERDTLLAGWNDTNADYDAGLTIPRAFEAQVERTPDATALVFEDQTLSYAELNARANHVARALQAAGVARGTNVGLCIRRSPDLLVGALAILKAGGTYVPLDPDHPAERLAHILSDSGAPVVLVNAATAELVPATAKTVRLDEVAHDGAAPANVDGGAGPDDLAYLIYTSGSTGLPKGVMVEHRNVANFFRGMDDCVDADAGAVWLAVTSISFDISVLELFYTLARGFKVVISGAENRAAVSQGPIPSSGGPMEFSVYFWGNDDGPGPQKYQLLLDAARYADEHGFAAIWTPERHFHAFGGPYPNPSVTGAAVAAVTRNISVRAGSIVAPLHHPARIAEDWAVIDNLTNGRAGLAVASGWHPDDFVLRPENTPPNNKPALFDALDKVRKLWRGDAVEFETAKGEMLPVKTLPRPVSKELEAWVTTAGNPATWREAGENGAHILTHLLGQSIEEVAEKIKIYHEALRGAGHDPADFKVTVMLHSFIADSREEARNVARGPMKDYLRSAAGLIKQYAWAFPAFKRPEGVKSPFEMDLGTLAEDELEAILDFAFERYFEDAGMFGTVADGVARADQLKRIGVTEIACLIDYGIASDVVLEGLKPLTKVMQAANAPAELDEDDFSLAAQIIRHGVTHLQCTPSMARIITQNDEAHLALRGLRQVLVGGEALSADLADDLHACTGARIHNMYGPTETTVWSTQAVVPARATGHTVTIGAPIANTQVYVLDTDGAPVPTGVAGELCIGGDGVTRGYWQRETLTTERFVDSPFAGNGTRMYRTGDQARWTAEGVLEFLGRDDHQIKIRGQRIELGEIEAAMARFTGVSEAVVAPRKTGAGDMRLTGYVTATGAVDLDALRAHLKSALPEAMVPADLMQIETVPLTPNKKVDRKALPTPKRQKVAVAPTHNAQAETGLEQQIATIWSGILGVTQIRAEDNFFDLGGHSLLAVQAHRDLRKALERPGLTITDIFRFPVPARSGADTWKVRLKRPSPRRRASEVLPSRAATMSKRRAMRAGRERQLS